MRHRQQEPVVNGTRLITNLQTLAQFGRTESGGLSRLAYSDPDLEARDYVTTLMRAAGLEPAVDLVGNLIGRRAGTESLPPTMFGSHIDSVPEGGNFDGQVGSIAAIEVAHSLLDHGIALRHPVEVVIFQNEEGGKTGSRAMSGEVQPEELALVTRSGFTILEGIRRLGGDPDRVAEVRRSKGAVAAYLELHIEQGPVLHQANIDIGVVEGIVGIKRWFVTFDGFANHAGTTPMDQRRDAIYAAARFTTMVRETVMSFDGRQVGTVGQIDVTPGAPNVIAGHVRLTLEIRDLSMDKIEEVFFAIRTNTRQIAHETDTQASFEQYYASRAALTDERLRTIIERSATDLGYSALRMPSGAGHDAQSIALLAPVGMIFVPSVGGVSHSPREFSRPADIERGANVLLRTLTALDD